MKQFRFIDVLQQTILTLICKVFGHSYVQKYKHYRYCKYCGYEETLWMNRCPYIGEPTYFWKASPNQQLNTFLKE